MLRTWVILAWKVRHLTQIWETTQKVHANCSGAGTGTGIRKCLAGTRMGGWFQCIASPSPELLIQHVGWRACVSNELPGDAHAPAPAPHSRKHWGADSGSHPCVCTNGHGAEQSPSHAFGCVSGSLLQAHWWESLVNYIACIFLSMFYVQNFPLCSRDTRWTTLYVLAKGIIK